MVGPLVPTGGSPAFLARRASSRWRTGAARPPLMTLRDAMIIGYSIAVTSLAKGLFSEYKPLHNTSVAIAGVGLVFLFVVSACWRTVGLQQRSVIWGALLTLSSLALLVAAEQVLAGGMTPAKGTDSFHSRMSDDEPVAAIMKASFVFTGLEMVALFIGNAALGVRLIVTPQALQMKLTRVAIFAYATYLALSACWLASSAIGSWPHEIRQLADLDPVIGTSGFWFAVYFGTAALLVALSAKAVDASGRIGQSQ